MTRTTFRGAGLDEVWDMRLLAFVLICAAWSSWQLFAEPETVEVDKGPSVVLVPGEWQLPRDQSAASPAGDESPSGLRTQLGVAWASVPGLGASPEPARDPLVQCALETEVVFARQSTCLVVGGRVDEPAWARLD